MVMIYLLGNAVSMVLIYLVPVERYMPFFEKRFRNTPLLPPLDEVYWLHDQDGAKTTKTGRFQVRYPHMKDGEMSSAVYVPKIKWQSGSFDNSRPGRNEWRTDKLGASTWDREGDWRLFDADVERIIAERKAYEQTARLLSEVQNKVREMRATWEGIGPKVEELARVLGIEPSEE